MPHANKSLRWFVFLLLTVAPAVVSAQNKFVKTRGKEIVSPPAVAGGPFHFVRACYRSGKAHPLPQAVLTIARLLPRGERSQPFECGTRILRLIHGGTPVPLFNHGPKRCRYSVEEMKAPVMSALM